MKEVGELEHMIDQCLKENMEVSFVNEETGVTVKTLIRGAVNYGAAAKGGREHMGDLLKKAYNQLKTSLAKR